MNRNLLTRMMPAIALTMGLGLAGCEMDINIDGDGVPLAELEMAGAAPDTLSIAAPDKVIITEGETLDITIDGSDEAAADLRFDLDGSDLAIYRESDWDGPEAATIRITMPAPRDINIGGSGDVEAPTMADRANINIGGSGNVKVAEFEGSNLELNIGGSGTVVGAGSIERLEVVIGGNGNVELADVKVGDAEVTIGGSGQVAFASDGNVEATIAGSGTINVTGDATCELSAFGSGTLNCAPATEAAAATETSDETPSAEAE